jgi:hypothetical protein
MYPLLKKFRSDVLVYLTHQMALPILKMIRKPEVFPYSKQQLQQFKEGSMGKDLVNFIEEKRLELLPYYARHDIKHILLDYDTTDEGEGCLQFFMLGNGHISFPVLATVVYCFVTMPEYWGKFKMAYQRGKRAPGITQWKWFEILELSTLELKGRIT